MASAPKPGVGKRKEAVADAKTIVVITYDGVALTLAWQNLPVGEKLAVRKQTGMALAQFIEAFDDDTFCVLYWLARRANGEPNLSFAAAVKDWDPAKVEDVDTQQEAAVEDDNPEA